MPWKFGPYWEDDDLDVQACAAGLSPEGDVAEVARRCGKHRNWASYRIADGVLEVAGPLAGGSM